MEKINIIETVSRVIKVSNHLDTERKYDITANVEIHGDNPVGIHNGSVVTTGPAPMQLATFGIGLPHQLSFSTWAECDRADILSAIEAFVKDIMQADASTPQTE